MSYSVISYTKTSVAVIAQWTQIHCYLPPAAEGRGWEMIKRLPCVRPFVTFCINLNTSFIYKDIFTKFAGNVYGYENLSLHNFSLILKNKMAAIADCLKIIKVL